MSDGAKGRDKTLLTYLASFDANSKLRELINQNKEIDVPRLSAEEAGREEDPAAGSRTGLVPLAPPGTVPGTVVPPEWLLLDLLFSCCSAGADGADGAGGERSSEDMLKVKVRVSCG